MPNKAIKILVILSLTVSQTFAQNLTQSPYSVIGLGDMHFQGNAQQSALGQLSQGYRRPFEVNNLNPASYSSLQQTVFEAGYLYSKGTLSNAASSTTIDNASFAYFNLGIPISQKLGISLVAGLMPFSAVGYNISSTKEYAGPQPYKGTTKMEGRGGLSRFYVGTSFRVHKYVSVGVNMNYLFGNIERNQSLEFDTSLHKFNIAEERTYSIQSIQYQTGIQYHRSFGEKYKITAGLTYEAATNLSATSTFTNRSLGWGGSTLFTLDTIEHYSDKKGNIQLPQSVKLGFIYERKGIWMVGADIGYTQWSGYRIFGLNDSLSDNLSMHLGGSIIPNSQNGKNYLNLIEYRAGLSYNTGNVKLNGTQISSLGLSAGLGLPLGKSKSRLNISGEYIFRGTTSDGLISENFFRIILGVTFSDQWFIRYKYD